MKRQTSYGFNKEKLIFVGTALLLAGAMYSFFASRPVELEVSLAVSPLPIPAPLEPDKADTRKALVKYYLESILNAWVIVYHEHMLFAFRILHKLCSRQYQAKCCAAALFSFHSYRAAMKLRDLHGDV